MKAVRYILLGLLALVVVLVVVVAIALWAINPNDYKPQIEKIVESKTRLDLQLNGDIGWSLFPIGLELNDVKATLDSQPFVKVQKLVAEIDFWSLVTMQPAVDTFVLKGLDANLVKNKAGVGNWQRIMPEQDDTSPPPTEPRQPQQPAPKPPQTPAGNQALQFNVSDVEISDARVHYEDATSGQAVTLDQVNLTASNIAPGQQFPLELSFNLDNAKPQMAVKGQLSAQASFTIISSSS